MTAAIPIGIIFVSASLAWGIAAQAHGLTIGEIVLLSAWVYSGPAQFAVLVPLAERFLFERNEKIVAWLSADDSSDVSAAGGVIGQHDIAGFEASNRAVAGFDFYLSRQRDDKLSSGRGVIAAQMGRDK